MFFLFSDNILEFLDLSMRLDPDDIFTPSPHTYYYTYNGKKHFYIPDVFIGSYLFLLFYINTIFLWIFSMSCCFAISKYFRNRM